MVLHYSGGPNRLAVAIKEAQGLLCFFTIHVVYENNKKPSASFMATGSPSAPGLLCLSIDTHIRSNFYRGVYFWVFLIKSSPKQTKKLGIPLGGTPALTLPRIGIAIMGSMEKFALTIGRGSSNYFCRPPPLLDPMNCSKTPLFSLSKNIRTNVSFTP